MFEFEGFGKRLQNLRIEKNMTQGELADRLGVTSQAVSKWENDQSYPDITLIPIIATIFNVEVNYLFGFKKKNINDIVSFPNTYENMALVHKFHNVACYSSKLVEFIDGSGVKFKDGSSAELSSNLVVNAGQGDIKLLILDDVEGNIDFSKSSKRYEFDYIDSLDIEVLSNKCELLRSKDNNCRVYAEGDARFISMMNVISQDGKLTIRFENKEGYKNISRQKNSITIELPAEIGKEIQVRVNGSGELTSDISKFIEGKISINGSGIIKVNDFTSCISSINGSGIIKAKKIEKANISINGSGNIDLESVGKLDASINGSGDIDVKSVIFANLNINGSGDIKLHNLSGEGEASLRISGSGNIDLLKGYCKKLDINIRGNGEIDASEITVQKASIILESNGEVTIGRVIESSIEQIKKKGTIRILNRGVNNEKIVRGSILIY